MTVVRDRRNEPMDDKYGTDKLRFRDLYLDQVRKAMHDKIAKDSLENLGKGGFKVPIPPGTTREPIFHHKQNGTLHTVFPGNVKLEEGFPRVYTGNQFDVGDKIRKPPGGGGGGGGNEPGEGESEDDFLWVNEDEFKNILFDGRKLPDMTKLKGDHIKEMERLHSGYTNKGPAHRMDMARTDKKRKEDEIVLTKTAERRILLNLSEQFNILAKQTGGVEPIEIVGVPKDERISVAHQAVNFAFGDGVGSVEIPDDAVSALNLAVEALKRKTGGLLGTEDAERIDTLENRLFEQFKAKSKAGDFRDEHLTYEYDEDRPRPSAKALMIFKMDVSASMSQEEKNNAKVFFWLLSQFLKEAYDQVEFVFIAHTTEAKEVDEQTFFFGRESGGTLVSTCHKKALEIIKERYSPEEWNIYSAQASDGDNVTSDNDVVTKLMREMMPMIQAHYYIEVPNSYRHQRGLTDLGLVYEKLAKESNGKVHVASDIRSPADALEAFKNFFPVGGRRVSATFAPAMA